MVRIYLINIIVLVNMAVATIDPLNESNGITKATEGQTPQSINILGFRSLIKKAKCGNSSYSLFNS